MKEYYEVKAYWSTDSMAWLDSNCFQRWGWIEEPFPTPRELGKPTTFTFTLSEDAVAFKLKFGV